MGAADEVSVVIRLSLVQLSTPDDMRGRVSAVNFLFVNASNQLGEFESGVTAAWLGAVPAVIIGGVGSIADGAAVDEAVPDAARRGKAVVESACGLHFQQRGGLRSCAITMQWMTCSGRANFSRRQFGALGLGAGVMAHAARGSQRGRGFGIRSHHQDAGRHLRCAFRASGRGAHAAVLVWPDIFGLRDRVPADGQAPGRIRLFGATVNPFYRMQKAPTAPPNRTSRIRRRARRCSSSPAR